MSLFYTPFATCGGSNIRVHSIPSYFPTQQQRPKVVIQADSVCCLFVFVFITLLRDSWPGLDATPLSSEGSLLSKNTWNMEQVS